MRGRITATAVVDRAVTLADAEGLAAVTIRRLAGDLGVTPMALYWHFRDKAALLGALVARVTSEVELPDPAATADRPWPVALDGLVRSIAALLRSHPWLAELTVGGDHLTAYLDVVEALLATLARAGFPPAEATGVADHILSVLVVLVVDECGPAGPDGPGRSPGTPGATGADQLAALPADRYPHVVAAAVPLTVREDPDVHHERGLRILLDGVQAAAARTAGHARSGRTPQPLGTSTGLYGER